MPFVSTSVSPNFVWAWLTCAPEPVAMFMFIGAAWAPLAGLPYAVADFALSLLPLPPHAASASAPAISAGIANLKRIATLLRRERCSFRSFVVYERKYADDDNGVQVTQVTSLSVSQLASCNAPRCMRNRACARAVRDFTVPTGIDKRFAISECE